LDAAVEEFLRAVACLLLCSDGASPAGAASGANSSIAPATAFFAGQTLSDALLALQAQGLALVYTSRWFCPG
jgi:hypothetical protein